MKIVDTETDHSDLSTACFCCSCLTDLFDYSNFAIRTYSNKDLLARVDCGLRWRFEAARDASVTHSVLSAAPSYSLTNFVEKETENHVQFGRSTVKHLNARLFFILK